MSNVIELVRTYLVTASRDGGWCLVHVTKVGWARPLPPHFETQQRALDHAALMIANDPFKRARWGVARS